MLQGKFINVNEVIRRVYRDSGLTSELPYQDAVEWVCDTIDLIDCPKALRPEVFIVTIENYKGKLPCNYHQMTHATGATSQGVIFDMTETGNTFHPTHNVVNENVNLSTSSVTWNGLIVDTSDPVGVDSAGNPAFNFTSTSELTTLPLATTELLSRGIPSTATYYLNSDYIFTSFETGFALISYLAYPFDCDGFPMIPDDIKFKLAVQWSIQERVDYMLWRTGAITDKVYQETSRQRDWYIGAAQNSGKMPSLNKMESMRKMFSKIMLRTDYHAHGFNIS